MTSVMTDLARRAATTDLSYDSDPRHS